MCPCIFKHTLQSCYYACFVNVFEEFVNTEQRELSHDACWILRDFISHCEDRRMDDGSNLFLSDCMFITRFYLTRGLTQAELTAHIKKFQIRI